MENFNIKDGLEEIPIKKVKIEVPDNLIDSSDENEHGDFDPKKAIDGSYEMPEQDCSLKEDFEVITVKEEIKEELLEEASSFAIENGERLPFQYDGILTENPNEVVFQNSLLQKEYPDPLRGCGYQILFGDEGSSSVEDKDILDSETSTQPNGANCEGGSSQRFSTVRFFSPICQPKFFLAESDEDSSDNIKEKVPLYNMEDLSDFNNSSDEDENPPNHSSIQDNLKDTEYIVVTLNPENCQITKPTKKEIPYRTIWKKVKQVNDVQVEPIFLSNEPAFTIYNGEEVIHSPITYFRKFVDDELVNTFVKQSNLYSVQQDMQQPLRLSGEEFEVWLGLAMIFSFQKISNARLHWSKDFSNEKFVNVMARDRWEKIKSRLHLVDNTKLDPNDKIFKIRPLVNSLRKKFQTLVKTADLCISESKIALKKLHKWGYKFYVLTNQNGLVYDFFIACGKIEPILNERIPDLEAHANIVLHLVKSIPKDRDFRLYFTNSLNSPSLQIYLASQKIWCCGTVKAKKLKNLRFVSDADLKAKGRGSFEEWESYVGEYRLTALKWYDKHIVHMLSSFLTSKPLVKKEGYDKDIKGSCPKMVETYNKYMRGVELHDQLISLSGFSFKSKKLYHWMLFYLIDLALVNAWLLYQRDCGNLNVSQKKKLSLSEFKMKVANSLIFIGKQLKTSERGRLMLEHESNAKLRKLNRGLPLPDEDIRYDHIDHLPAVDKKRHMCKMKDCNSRVTTFCLKCKVFLCISNKHNCFVLFHTK